MKDTKELIDTALRHISNGNTEHSVAYSLISVVCELQNMRETLKDYFSILLAQQDHLLRAYDVKEDIFENGAQLEFDFNKR